MIRTTGFKRAFLIPSNRRPSLYMSNVSTGLRSFEYFGRRLGSNSGFVLSTIYDFERQKKSLPMASYNLRYNVKPETFRRLFQLPWKNK